MTWYATLLAPQLPISVARRDDPALARRPLLIYDAASPRPVVTAASADSGIAPGMALCHARLRCPDARCRPADPAALDAAVGALRAVLAQVSPTVTVDSTTPDARLTGDLGRWALPDILAQAAALVQRAEAAVHLPLALGVAACPLVAGIAAAVAGGGRALVVSPGQEARFLAPQPVARLPIAPELAARLAGFGLDRIGRLAALPRDALEAQFGALGGTLAALARGLDPTPRPPPAPERQLALRWVPHTPVCDRRTVAHGLAQLADGLATRLARRGWAAAHVTLTITPDAGAPIVGARALDPPTAQAARLRTTLDALCDAGAPRAVAALAVRVHATTPPATRQLSLFAADQAAAAARRAGLARLAARYPGRLLRVAADPGAVLASQRVQVMAWDDDGTAV
jgi:nucleotidyltransferase/DNA polymerase involved in DNA repair